MQIKKNQMEEAIKRASGAELKLLAQEIQLNPEQYECFEEVTRKGKSVFISGVPESGKGFTALCIFHRLKYGKKVTAFTTVSSSRLRVWEEKGVQDVCTVHSFAGIKLGGEKAETLAHSVPKDRWIQTEVWIVDGIHSLSFELFQKLNVIGQMIRKRPDVLFGGIQMVFIGDFYQSSSDCFCFESEAWKQVKSFFFQTSYTEFGAFRKEIREGILSDETKSRLRERAKSVVTMDRELQMSVSPIVPSVLMVTETVSRRYNGDMLSRLDSEKYVYRANFEMKERHNPESAYMYYMKGTNVPQVLELKVGAQVLCITDGRRGIVTGFESSRKCVGQKRGAVTTEFDCNATGHDMILPLVSFGEKSIPVKPRTWKRKGVMKVFQLPLDLAFAVSFSGTAGMTISSLEINLQMWKPHHLFMALSRAESLQHVIFTSVATDSFDDLLPDDRVIEYYATFI